MHSVAEAITFCPVSVWQGQNLGRSTGGISTKGAQVIGELFAILRLTSAIVSSSSLSLQDRAIGRQGRICRPTFSRAFIEVAQVSLRREVSDGGSLVILSPVSMGGTEAVQTVAATTDGGN